MDWSEFARILPRGRSEFKGKIRWNQEMKSWLSCLQWMRLYTLRSRGSQELKTFLKIRLISSRINQKLKNKERITSGFKEKISPISWVIEAVVEAVLLVRGSDSLGRHRGFPISMEWAGIWLQISLKKTMIFATIGPWSGHDRVTIGPWSWVNRDPESPSVAVWSNGGASTT